MGETAREHQVEKSTSFDVLTAPKDQKDALDKALQVALQDPREQIEPFPDMTASGRLRRLQQTQVRTRKVVIFLKQPDSKAAESGLKLVSTEEATVTRKHIFQRFPCPRQWSPPDYELTYFYDRDEYHRPTDQVVVFRYSPTSGHLSVEGQAWLFPDLGLNDRDPLEVFADLVDHFRLGRQDPG